MEFVVILLALLVGGKEIVNQQRTAATLIAAALVPGAMLTKYALIKLKRRKGSLQLGDGSSLAPRRRHTRQSRVSRVGRTDRETHHTQHAYGTVKALYTRKTRDATKGHVGEN